MVLKHRHIRNHVIIEVAIRSGIQLQKVHEFMITYSSLKVYYTVIYGILIKKLTSTAHEKYVCKMYKVLSHV